MKYYTDACELGIVDWAHGLWVYETYMTTRILRVAAREGWETIGQLRAMDEKVIRRTPGLGRKCCEAIFNVTRMQLRPGDDVVAPKPILAAA